MTGVRDVRCQIRAVVMCMMLAAAYGAGAVLSENQNSYLLHAAARAGWGDLARDSMARSADPFPVFTALAAPALRAPIFVALGGAFLAAVAVYAWALVGIVRATFGWRAGDPALAATTAVVALCHSRWLASTSMRAFGVDARALLVDGVASQYLLGRVLQPSVAGVLLLVSIYAFLRGRPFRAVLWSSAAATLHATYLLSAALLTAAYAGVLARRGERARAAAVAAASLALVAPAVLYAAATFGPTDAGTFRRAAEILADERIALHARVAAWFGPAAILKAAICAAALGIVRRRPIFPLLWPAVVVGVAGSLLLAAFPDPMLALQFPWRVSVWLVPISTAVLVGAAVESIHRRIGLRADRWRMPAIVVASLVVAFGIAGTLREARAVDRRIDSPLRAYVAGGAPNADVYLIPPGMEDFRLRTRSPIVVDAKTHPYRDVEVLEWRDRLRRAEAFYADSDPAARCARLRDIVRRDGATRVVVPIGREVACPGVDRVYSDAAFIVFTITMSGGAFRAAGGEDEGPGLRDSKPAGLQPPHAIARGGEPRVVRRDHRRQAEIAVHLAQQAVERFRRRLVEIAGGLVGEQQLRTHHQRPGDGHALLLAAGEHARHVRQPLAEADAAQQLVGARACVRERHARDAHRHLRVLDRVELRQQMMELEDEADAVVPERDDLGVAQPRQVSAVDRDRPLIDAIEAAEQVQQRALADARRADDGGHLAGVHLEIEIAKHRERLSADRIALDEAARVEKGHQS